MPVVKIKTKPYSAQTGKLVFVFVFGRTRRFVVLLLLFFIAIACVVLTYTGQSETQSVSVLSWEICLGFVFAILLFDIRAYRSMLKHLKTSAELQMDFAFYDEYITVETEETATGYNAKTRFDYSFITKAFETVDFLLLRNLHGASYVLPKNSLSPDTTTELKELLFSHGIMVKKI
jgi:hypothetical protein